MARGVGAAGRLSTLLMRKLVVLALTAAILATASVSALALSIPTQAKVGDSFLRPGKITINRGAKVTWKWVGYLTHNVTVRSGPVRFHSRDQVRGSFSHVFAKPGTYSLFCTLHPRMKETVTVR
jgi:plastocyanin